MAREEKEEEGHIRSLRTGYIILFGNQNVRWHLVLYVLCIPLLSFGEGIFVIIIDPTEDAPHKRRVPFDPRNSIRLKND